MAAHARSAVARFPRCSTCARRDLREQLYRANVARASAGEDDNTPLIAKILRLRREEARLLGFATFAELSLAPKMAPDVARGASSCSRSCARVSYTAARARARGAPRVRARARRDRGALALGHRVLGRAPCARSATRTAKRSCARTSRCPPCSTGLFALAERLFGVRIRAADGEAPVWHPDVRFFRVDDEAGPAARGVLPRSLLAAGREARRRVDGRVPRPQPAVRRPARARAPAGRATWSATRRRPSATSRR